MTTLALRIPIKLANGSNRQLTELEMRDHLTYGDLRRARRMAADAVKGGDADDLHHEYGYRLIATFLGLDMKELEQMDVRDVDAVDQHLLKLRGMLPKQDAEMSTESESSPQ